MKRTVCFLGGLLLAAGMARGEAAPEVRVFDQDGAHIREIRLPGWPVTQLAVRSEDRDRLLILMADGNDPEGPRTLLFWHLEDVPSGSTVTELAHGLPADVHALAHFDLDGDGRSEVLLGQPGRLSSLGVLGATTAEARTVLESPGFDLRDLVRRGFFEGPVPWLAVPLLGRVELHGSGAPRTFDLPVAARRSFTGLVLETPKTTALWLPGASTPLYAVGPEAHGSRRLRSLLIDPTLKEDDENAGGREAWALLPHPENVEASWYHVFDGEPVLVVTTLRSDKLGLFEKQKLRVFPLSADRTRGGVAPTFAATTGGERWGRIEFRPVDVDGDGHSDLPILKRGNKLGVRVHRGRGGGRFEEQPLVAKIKMSWARWSYGHDLDGDGVPDLVARSRDVLAVFAGQVNVRKKQVLEKEPRWNISATTDGLELVGWPEVLEFGQGRRMIASEAVLEQDGDKRGVLWLVELR